MRSDKIPVFVISMESEIERRASISTQLRGKDISFSFFNAISGEDETNPYLLRYDESEFILNYGRPALPGEVGCYTSHFSLWKKCIELNRPIIILEDDAKLTQDFSFGFACIKRYIDEWGFVRFQKPDKSSSFYRVFDAYRLHLVKYTKAPQNTLGYALSPQVAQAFINSSSRFSCPVDVFIRRFNTHKQPIYGFIPPLVESANFPSMIGERKRGYKKGPWLRIQILLRKLKTMCMCQILNIGHRVRPTAHRSKQALNSCKKVTSLI